MTQDTTRGDQPLLTADELMAAIAGLVATGDAALNEAGDTVHLTTEGLVRGWQLVHQLGPDDRLAVLLFVKDLEGGRIAPLKDDRER